MSEDTVVVFISGTAASQQMCHTLWYSHINSVASPKWSKQRQAKRKRDQVSPLPLNQATANGKRESNLTIITSDFDD